MAEYLDAHEHAGQRHRVRRARRGDDAAQREDGDARGRTSFDGADVIVRSHASSATSRPAPRLRHLLPEHRRREVHVQRRARRIR